MVANRKTRFAVRCKGTIIGHVDSYNSIELEHEALLHTASKAAGEGGFDCMNKWNNQNGVACEELTVTEVKKFGKAD